MNRLFVDGRIQMLAELDAQIKSLTKTKKALEAELQSEMLSEIENKNLKYLECSNAQGTVTLAYKNKLEVDDRELLIELFGDMVRSKVKVEIKEDIKVTNKHFARALIALYKDDYKEHNLELLLHGLGLEDVQIKTALKKLKGEYLADKELLNSFGCHGDELEEELDIIKEHKDWELVRRFFGSNVVDMDKLKRAIFVEETLAFGTKFGDMVTEDGAV